MQVFYSQTRRSLRRIVIVIALLSVSAGCAYIRPLAPYRDIYGDYVEPYEEARDDAPLYDEPQLDPPPLRKATIAETVLAAARANRVSMFGEMADTDTSGFTTRPLVSLRQHTFSEEGSDFDVRFNRDGTRIIFSSTRHSMNPNVYVKATDGVAVTQLTSDPAADVHAVFSPDGSRVAFSSDRSGNWDIWVMPVTGGRPIQVTDGPSDEVHPSWSPDGSRLVYCSLPSGGRQWELWLADSRTASTKKFIGYGLFPEWSPVEDVILYQRARQRGSRWFSVWTTTLEDGEPRYPTEIASSSEHALILPSWSRDGRRITFTALSPSAPDPGDATNTKTVSDIWVMASDGRGRVRLTDGYTANYGPAFAPDGRIFFTSNRSGSGNLWSIRSASALAIPMRSTNRMGNGSGNGVKSVLPRDPFGGLGPLRDRP